MDSVDKTALGTAHMTGEIQGMRNILDFVMPEELAEKDVDNAED